MIIIFCGIPGSGKTTIAKKLLPRLKKRGTARLFISDQLKPPVYKKFFQLLKTYRGRYDYLIFDATFYKKKWRDRLKARAGKEGVATIYLKCPVKTAVLRNRRRRLKIPASAVHIIASQMEPPKHPAISINTDHAKPQAAVNKILKVLK